MEQPDRNTIEELLPSYCEGSLTGEERRMVELWIEEADENRRVAKQIHTLYLAADTVCMMRKVDTEKALSKVKRSITGRRQMSGWGWTQRIAAVLFIPLLAVCLIQYFGRAPQQQQIQLIEVKTNPGMMTSLTLPDGTLVHLNSESTLTYPSRFDGDTRNVTLLGEAYFEVAKNPEKRFLLSTNHHSQIEVLGTHFNVEAYANESQISTTLVEGKVSFHYQKNTHGEEVVMQPGQKLVYDSTSGSVMLYQTLGERETAWKDGKIVCNNTPLGEVIKMLERRYNVDIICKDPKLERYSFTGTFTNQRLERIMEYFKLSSHINWHYVESSEITDKKSKIEIY